MFRGLAVVRLCITAVREMRHHRPDLAQSVPATASMSVFSPSLEVAKIRMGWEFPCRPR
jgi:hypothetical protein